MTAAAGTGARERYLTIGAVCRRLHDEFADISISKIRYLEDQGLLAPRRTRGGYRLFTEEDVERLETILRLQRDEFLPLRVIRDELTAPGTKERAKRRRPSGLQGREDELDLDELCERAGVDRGFVKELEEYGLLAPQGSGGDKRYPESDSDVLAACAQLAALGITPRHLRTFRLSVDRETALLEQLVAPALRSRNPERRAAGKQDLQKLAELGQELTQLLLWRDLRRIAGQ
ncbi:MAG TPA: MerR family transcriptional regulator [Gaiellaceae bacterium]|jgi:DNA-binding transcriptional MerR regulator|nr:MerR family transcriptional regulator [Gaiellaceae bacterium]